MESLSDGLGVIDIHTHPTLKIYMFRRCFWRRHWTPAGMKPPVLRTDLPALLEGGVRAVLASIYVVEKAMVEDVWPMKLLRAADPRSRHVFTAPPEEVAWEYMDHLDGVLAKARRKRGDVIELASSHAHMHRIMEAGKIAILHSMEGAHHLGGKLENLDRFHARGLCHLILPHFYENEAVGCVDPIPKKLPLRRLGCFKHQRDPNAGLTDFGRELLDYMFDLGVIADMTHATPAGRAEMLDRAKAHPRKRPVIMSHVGVHALNPDPMNPNEEDIRRIADTGGVVGIIFMGYWLVHPERRHCAEVVMKTIDHLVEHGGDEVVAFGSDFDGFTGVPVEYRSPRDYVTLRQQLLDRYGAERAAKFLHGNADRVLREGWDAPAKEASREEQAVQ